MLKHMPDSHGGSVVVFAARIALTRGPRLLPMYASSAATMWLGYRDTYVDPKSTFGFHKVSRDYTGIATRIYEAHLRAASPELLDWFRGKPNNSTNIVRISGKQLIINGWATSIEEYYDMDYL